MITSQLSDEKLLERIAAQDKQALDLLYDRHAQVVYSLILRIVRNEHAAEDLLQEAFWQVWRSAGSYQGSGAGAAWIYRVARNKALDYLRRMKVRPTPASESVKPDEQGEMAPARTSSVEQSVEQRWRAGQVQAGMQSMPHEQRVCVELAYFEGLSQSEIAEQLDLPLGTVKTRLRLSVEKLEGYLMAAGLHNTDEGAAQGRPAHD